MTTRISLSRALLLAALAAVPLAQAAAQSPARPDPADPKAAVAATSYRPVLDYRPVEASTTTPDQNWKASNTLVGSYNSMALTMGDMPAPPPKTPPEPQAQPAKPVPDPHAHHQHKEHK